MKLAHLEHTFQIVFEENVVQRIVVESPHIFSEWILDLKQQMDGKEGKWVLSHDGEILPIKDYCECIIDFFSLEINQRKIINALYEKLASEINDTELLVEWHTACSQMESVLSQAIDNSGYDVVYEDMVIKTFLKNIDVKFREKETGFLDYLLEYLELNAEVRGIKLFILVNLTAYLEDTDILYLYEQAFYKKYYLLLLDNHERIIDKEIEKVTKVTILDKDGCVIDIDMK